MQRPPRPLLSLSFPCSALLAVTAPATSLSLYSACSHPYKYDTAPPRYGATATACISVCNTTTSYIHRQCCEWQGVTVEGVWCGVWWEGAVLYSTAVEIELVKVVVYTDCELPRIPAIFC